MRHHRRADHQCAYQASHLFYTGFIALTADRPKGNVIRLGNHAAFHDLRRAHTELHLAALHAKVCKGGSHVNISNGVVSPDIATGRASLAVAIRWQLDPEMETTASLFSQSAGPEENA